MKEQKQNELNDAIHEQILAGGQRRFPLESYQRLLASGTSRELALEMLGWKPTDPGLPV